LIKTLKNHSQQPHHFNQKNVMTEITNQIRRGIFPHQLTHQIFFISLSHIISTLFSFFSLIFFSHLPHLSHTIMSLFHGHEGFFVKRLNREKIKNMKKYYLNEIVIINS